MEKIFIPSKGRNLELKRRRTWDHLEAEGIPCTVVVEPQDAAYYEAHIHSKYQFVSIGRLDQNDRGLTYARQFILGQNSEPHWVIDDDIQSVAESTPTGIQTVSWHRIFELMQYVPEGKIFLSGPSYVQAARGWDARPYRFNRNIATFVRVHPQFVRVPYNTDQLLFQDLRFVLENVLAGSESCNYRHALFRCPQMGGKGEPGGCGSYYHKGEEYAEKFVKEVPHCTWDYNNAMKVRIVVDWRAIDREVSRG